MKTLAAHGTIRSGVEYWPSYVDILTTVLMVFVLQNFLQTTLNIENFEVARIREAQRHLKEILQLEFPVETAQRKITLDDSKPNLLQVRFSEEILFASADYHLAGEGRNVLGKCAQVLRSRPGSSDYKQIEVQGHTDKRPMKRFSYPRNNWELSAARALEVVRFLLAQGLPGSKLSAGGYAETRPVETSAEHQHLNRRIELRILFATPDQPPRRGQ
ncbi:MAG TPA: OmpA family protein [Candidatus Angelobacter sp.]